ncbi:MAG: DUF2208 family protein [Acidilobaceae archaeon]
MQCGGERSGLRGIASLLVFLVVGAVLSALLDILGGESYVIMVLILAFYFAINYGPTLLISDPFGRYMLSGDVGGVKLLWEGDLGVLKSRDPGVAAEEEERARRESDLKPVAVILLLVVVIGLGLSLVTFHILPHVIRVLEELIGSPFLARVLAYLALWGGFFLALYLLGQIIGRIWKLHSLTVTYTPEEYYVVTRGIAYRYRWPPLWKFIQFPLNPGVTLEVNGKRGFVEVICRSESGDVAKLRFYSRDPKVLYETLVRYGALRQLKTA